MTDRTRYLIMGALIAAYLVTMLLLAGCASDPYPNDRSMKNMSAAQLTLELSK